MQVFHNTRLARTWDEGGSTVESSHAGTPERRVRRRASPRHAWCSPPGVDVQDDRLEVEVVGWGIGFESWGIEYRVFMGDPSKDLQVWAQLDEFLKRAWVRADGVKLGISCTCVDSGGHCTSQVYRFTKLREQRRIFAIKGRGGPGVPQIGKPTRAGREKAVLFTLGVDALKTLLYSRFAGGG